MKQNFYSLLLTALLGMTGLNAWAQSATYEIGSAADLVAFAQAVNGGQTGANAVLTDNIDLDGTTWTPIGNADKKYTGTFDGQGYAILNFEYTATSDYNGLFGYISNATVKNFSISGTLTSDGYTKNGVVGCATGTSKVTGIHSSMTINVSNFKAHTGGIVGGDNGATTDKIVVDGCEFSGTLTHSGTGDCQAGIMGYTGYSTIRNCIFSGTINGENNKYGGILGYSKQPSFGGVQNCLSIGKIVAADGCTTAAAIIANFNGGTTSNVKNNYYCLQAGSTTTIAIGNKASSCEAPHAVTAEQLESGEVCYLLNGDQSNLVFYQTLGTDEVPSLDASRSIVYLAGQTHCDGTPYASVSGYSNTANVQDDHQNVDGFCSYCGAFIEDGLTANTDGYYEISNATQLQWFAAKVNSGDMTVNAILTNDIDMSTLSSWSAIGDWGSTPNGTACFKGHFNGQGFAINNFNFTATRNYFGLFGVISTGALIENFSISGSISNSGYQYVAGVATYARDENPTIRNVRSYVNITSTYEGGRHGGILGGSLNGTVKVDHCAYFGTLKVPASGNFGGIVAYVNNNTDAHLDLTDCLFDGKIEYNGSVTNPSCACGGIIGYNNKGLATIKDCLSLGSITTDVRGQIFGLLNGNNSKVYNCYYQGDYANYSTSEGTASPLEATLVTEAKLQSGEIAFLLNESVSGGTNWYQQIKNMAFAAEKYVVTTNGTPRDPQTANVTLVGETDGTYTFTLPNFVLHTNMADLPVGDLRLEGITIKDDGTFSEDNTFSVPDENIPSLLGSYSAKLKNVAYTLDGKVNGDRLYATIEDISIELGSPFPAYQITIEVGTDDFVAQAPTGDAYPKPYGTSLVYANGSFKCDMTPKEGSDVIYSNVNATFVDDHTFVSGFCSVCGTLNETWLTPNADGDFEIGTLAQLKWFAAYVNQVNASANAILTGNIDMEGIEWTPIGNSSVAFTGKFDGHGKSITNFAGTSTGYFGIIGYANGATIKNFSVDGTMTVNSGTGSGVIGWAANSTVSGIHSTLNIAVPGDDAHHAAGVVGSCQGGNTVSGCYFSGTLTVTGNTRDCFGGVVGYFKNDNLTNCANYGTLSYTRNDGYVGGVVGYINNADAHITNSLATGTVTYAGEGTPTYGGTLVGRLANHTAANFSNNYWLTGTAPEGRGSGGNTIAANQEVTAEQIASGEVAYLLGAAWGQLLGTDANPVPGSSAPVSYVGAAGYATLYDTTTGYNLNGDVKAYAAVLNNTWLELSEIPSIPESTPVVLKGGYYNKLAADLPAINVANDLKGTDADTAADGSMYILANGADGIGFYLATGTIPAGKAYFQSTSGVKTFFFEGDDATGINEVNGQWPMANGQSIYSLAGQRIQKMQKGINIVGKKKVLY